MMSNLPMMKRQGEFLAVLAVSGILLGCSSHFSNNNTTPASLPGAGQQTTSSTYAGTQSPGYWSLALDDTQKVFSYQPITNATSATTPVQGGFSVANGIDDFGTTSSGASAGLAVEIPSRITTLRPGDNTTAPVNLVAQSTCFAVTGDIRYTYVGILGGLELDHGFNHNYPAYGSFVVSTSTDGKSWQFGDVRGYQLPNNKVEPPTDGIAPATNALLPFPLVFSGSCQSSNGVATVTPSANPAITVTLPTFAFHSAGYFVMDQPNQGSDINQVTSWVGFAMPRSPLSTALVTAGTYSGFVYEPRPIETTVVTQPVSLSPASGVSATLAGGPYADDDSTKTPLALYTLTLGTQDSTLNGVFPSATLNIPDPLLLCPFAQSYPTPVKPGFDSNGNSICITQGVAVVAAPDGKYVIYFTALDGTSGSQSVVQLDDDAHPLQMYLYQQ